MTDCIICMGACDCEESTIDNKKVVCFHSNA